MAVRVTFEFHDQQFRSALERMTLTANRRAGLLGAIATGLLHTTQGRFRSQTTPVGSHWQTLSPAYAASKRAGLFILSRSGQLQQSLVSKAVGSTVMVGSNKVYAAVHQFGATIRPTKASGPSCSSLGGRTIREGEEASRSRRGPTSAGGASRPSRKCWTSLGVLLPGAR